MSPTSTPPQTALSIQPLTVLVATLPKENPTSGDRQRGARSLMKRLILKQQVRLTLDSSSLTDQIKV